MADTCASNSTYNGYFLHHSMSSYGSTHTLLIASAIMLSWYPRVVLVYMYRSVSAILKNSLMKAPTQDARNNATVATILLRESSVMILVVLYLPVLYVWKLSHAVISTSRKFNRLAYHSSRKYLLLPKGVLGRRVRWQHVSATMRMSEWNRSWLTGYHHGRLRAYTKKMILEQYTQYLQRISPPTIWRTLWKQTLRSWRCLTRVKGNSFKVLLGMSVKRHTNRVLHLQLNPKDAVLSLARLCLGYDGRTGGYIDTLHPDDYRLHHHKYDILKQYNTRYTLYRKVPLRSISRLWGRINSLELPVWLRHPTIRLYIWAFGCKLEEAAIEDLSHYHNLCEFFQRKLKPGLRPIDGVHILTSPADGRILHFGKVENSLLEQVKGVTYSLEGFLGPIDTLVFNKKQAEGRNSLACTAAKEKSLGDSDVFQDLHKCTNVKEKLLVHTNTDLHYCTVYLAPGDYHRFHSPADWHCYARRHFPGELFSVSPGVARWFQGLFTFNERVVYTGRWRHGFFSYTPVGATNVGSINVYFDKALNTNIPHKYTHGNYDELVFNHKKKPGMKLTKGSLVGDFNLGSTIVLIFEAPKSFSFKLEPGQIVKYGQPLGGLKQK